MSAQPTDFIKYFEESISSRRRGLVSELGFEALAWLALPPIWTDELAKSAHFPNAPQGRMEFLAECEKLGWCVRRPVPMTSRREDAAEILINLAETLSARARETDIWRRVVEAAASAIGHVEVLTLRRSLRKRLSELAGADVVRLLAPVADDAAPGGPEAVDLAAQLVDRRAWTELRELLKAARPAQLQRIVLRHLSQLPAAVLESAIVRIAETGAPRVAATILADSLTRLSREPARSLVDGILPAVRRDQRGADAAFANLAVAAGYGGDLGTALRLCDRLPDDRLRAWALGRVAGVVARGPERQHTADIASRIARVIVDGEGVDLAGTADAVAQLAEADALEFATPIISVLRRLDRNRLTAADIGPLVKLAASIRSPDYGGPVYAVTLATTAQIIAEGLAEPSARADGLTRVLPVVAESARAEIAGHALSAARQVSDVTERARALCPLAAYLPPDQLGTVIDEIIDALGPAEPGDAFWVPDSARAGILAELEREKQLPWLRGQAAAIGQAVEKLSRNCLVPPDTRRWAVLAAKLTENADEVGAGAGEVLRERVDDLLGSGLTTEALGWIETGRSLLRVIRGEFDSSLLIAARKVELSRRTADDRRLLQRFLRREDQLRAFRTLLATQHGDSPWALHYLGAGGVGKTMLLRHISAELATGSELIVARVDFDHLNPDFPRTRPGLLLLSLLKDLEAHASPETRELYENAKKVLEYQEQAPGSVHAGAVSQAMDDAVRRFCAYLQALEGRVVLILDTCEELAKFESAGAVLPQVHAAFRLIERIHDELPSVLVILAGRRPLADQVHNGQLRDPRRPESGIPVKKPYLMVHEVIGFTEPEAREYLSDREGLTLDEPDIIDLLDRSRSGPYKPDYDNAPNPAGTSSHIPFDLAQYAAALREDSNYLRSARRDIAYATYVRDRIASRLMPNATQLLPAVVLMRRFDRDMLAAAIAGMELPITSAEAWRELGSIEWISTHYDHDSAQRASFMEVDRTMLERLQAFYAVDQPAGYDLVRRQLADRLAEIVRARPLDELTVEHVDAALRCLAPAHAAELCDTLSLRVAASTEHWMWAYAVFGRVLGMDGALAAPDHPAAASATALHATALSQVEPTEDLRDQWRLVASIAASHPRPAIARWLVSRAALLADPADTGRWLDAMSVVRELFSDGQDGHATWLAGTILASVSKATESAGTEQELEDIARRQDVLGELIEYPFGPQVLAVARVLLARMLLVTDEVGAAAEQFHRAIELTREPLPEDTAAEASADGAIPGNIRDWVRLEAALVNPPGVELMTEGTNWLDQALEALRSDSDSDSDRLAALLLGRLLDERPLPREKLRSIQDVAGSEPPPAARTRAHAAIPPLRVVLSRAWLVLGDVAQARSALGPRDFAETEAEQRMLDLARVQIARRMRLVKSDPWVRRKLREAYTPVEAPQVYETMTLLGEGQEAEPETFRPPVHLHAWWHAEATPGRIRYDDLDNAFVVARQWCPPDQHYLAEALLLDHVELTQRAGNRLAGWRLTEPLRAMTSRYRWPPRGDEELWRLGLRKMALGWGAMSADSRGLATAERLAVLVPGRTRPATRRLAELALEEGELLALRVPDAGGRLLLTARDWFEEASDPVGALIAHTAGLMATARSTKRGPGETELKELNGTYESACNDIPELPRWDFLKNEGVYAAAVSGMPKPTRSAWEGWLLRLRWLRDGAPEAWRGLDPKTTAIPPELGIHKQKSLVRQTLAGAVQSKDPATRQVPHRLTEAGHQSILAAAVLLAATLLGVSAYYMTIAAGGLLVMLISLTASLTVVAALIGFHVVTVGPHRSRASVEIEPGPTSASVSVRISTFPSRRWHLRPGGKEAEVQVQMEQRPTVPVRQETEIHRLLCETASPEHRLPVALEVARSLVEISWESWLGAELTDVGLSLQRSYRLLLENPPVAAPQPGGCVYWFMSPPRWSNLISKALPDGHAKATSQFPAASPGDVLVIVAVAVSTAAGRRLVIHQGQSRHNDLVIDPDEAVLTDLTIVVLGEPRGERSRASTAQSVAALRACAADLIDAGARTVIVVPNAPSIVASHVLASLTRTLRPSGKPSAKDLRDAEARARELLENEADRELAYELTVMSRTPS